MGATQAVLAGLGCLKPIVALSKLPTDVLIWLLHAQAAVVGLTCRTDAIELLEKRVRSRFSHRRQLVLELTAAEAQGVLQLLVLLQAGQNCSLLLCTDLERDVMTQEGAVRQPIQSRAHGGCSAQHSTGEAKAGKLACAGCTCDCKLMLSGVPLLWRLCSGRHCTLNPESTHCFCGHISS